MIGAVRRLVPFGVASGVLVLLAACGSSAPAAPPLLLAGPTTDIMVTIPDGWHQVINSSSPIIPEMVTPTDCLGSNEVACADGLIRIATTTATDPAAAAHAVSEAVIGEEGNSAGPVSADGPASVGSRDGYRMRFTFTNQRGAQNAQIAVVPSGAVAPDPQGQREFSVVLAWVAERPRSAPGPTMDTVDQVIDSILVHGGDAPRR